MKQNSLSWQNSRECNR